MLVGGVFPPHVSTLISYTHAALVVSLNFTSLTLVSPSTKFISPLASVNTTTGSSNMVVTGIPNVTFTSSLLFQTFQNNPNRSTSFF